MIFDTLLFIIPKTKVQKHYFKQNVSVITHCQNLSVKTDS